MQGNTSTLPTKSSKIRFRKERFLSTQNFPAIPMAPALRLFVG